MAGFLIPLSIIGLSFFGLTFLIAIFSMALIEKVECLRFLRGEKATGVVCTLSAVTAAGLTVLIWISLNLPLI